MKKRYLIPLLILLLGTACKETTVVYEIDPVTVRREKPVKQNQKSASAFISVAYSDLMGESIPPEVMKQLIRAYDATGDKKMVEDMVIRYLLMDRDSIVINRSLGYMPAQSILQSEDPVEKPFELVYVIHQAFVMHAAYNRNTGSFNYANWQTGGHMAHAPGGNNLPPLDLTGKEILNWYRSSAEEWAKAYPEELELAKWHYKTNILPFWKSIGGEGYSDLKEKIYFHFKGDPPQDPKPIVLPIEATEMRADVKAFIFQAYETFFNREPTAYEEWYLKDLIESDASITPKMIYYSMMKSEEYRYY